MGIPNDIKRKIFFHQFSIVVAGVIVLTLIFIIQCYLTSTPTFQAETLTSTFIVLYILATIFLVLYPGLLLILNIDSKRIIKNLKKSAITEKDLHIDYDSASKHGKVRIGELCTYFTTFYHYHIIPNKKILTVIKRTKERKTKKVVKYKNGAVQRTLYNISTHKQYFVDITDIHGRKVSVFCNKERTCDDIIAFYHRFPNIMFVDIQNPQMRKQVKEMKKKLLEEERQECNEE